VPTTTRIRAAVAESVGEPLVIRELDLDEPRANEVRVRMVATGVCHTDAVVRDGVIPTTFPIVLGHEGAGVVEAVGPGIEHLAAGDHVVLTVGSCGVCAQCLHGHPGTCADSYRHNFAGGRVSGGSALAGPDGGAVSSHFFGQSSFAERANVHVRSVVKVPDDIPLERLGPLGCGVQTGAGSVLNVLQPRPGDSVAVFGAGAVGMSAVLAAVSARAGTVVAVDVVDSRLEFARAHGAHAVDARTEDVVARVQELTGGGAQHALDTTGNPAVFAQMIESLGAAGHAGAVGAAAAGSEGVIALPTALSRGIRVTWIVEGDAVPQTFIPELIALWQAGDFPFDELVETYPFDELQAAFDDSESGRVLKPVVVF
jgi:aryl-alcohol dehydrogenase